MKKESIALWIAVLSYVGITFADIMKLIDTVLTEYGKLILFVGIVYLLSKK